MHWGAFRLTDEPRDEPARLLAECARAAGLEEGAFGVIEPGESVVMDGVMVLPNVERSDRLER
jgi:hypothetical protein